MNHPREFSTSLFIHSVNKRMSHLKCCKKCITWKKIWVLLNSCVQGKISGILDLVSYFFLTNNMESCLRKVLNGAKTHWDWGCSLEYNLVLPKSNLCGIVVQLYAVSRVWIFGDFHSFYLILLALEIFRPNQNITKMWKCKKHSFY